MAATEGVSYVRPPLCGWTDRDLSTTKLTNDSGQSTGLGAVRDEDEEDRRWQEYADRWGTDQWDEGPWTSTGTDYVALAYLVVSVPVRVWLLLLDLGVVG